MTGGNVTDRQWQEVESIVRKYQRNMEGNPIYTDEYNNLNTILDELYDLAHGAKVCDPQALVCKDHLTDE